MAVGVGLLVTGPQRRPAERVYTPAGDAYVSAAHPDTNYGTLPVLRADASPRIRSYLRFRLDDLPGRRVVRAELRLWSGTGDLSGISVHPIASTRWDEHVITAADVPTPGRPAATSGPFGPMSWSRVDVTPLVSKSGRQLTLVLTTGNEQGVEFDSREGSAKPQLVVATATT
jgi:hypothetical protein